MATLARPRLQRARQVAELITIALLAAAVTTVLIVVAALTIITATGGTP